MNNLGIVFEESLLDKSVAINGPLIKISECQKTHLSVRLVKEHSNKLDILSFEKFIVKKFNNKEIIKLQPWKKCFHKIEKSSKIGQDKKRLVSSFACFFNCYYQSLIS